MRFLDWLLRPLTPFALGVGENDDPAGTGGTEGEPEDPAAGRRDAIESALAGSVSGEGGTGDDKGGEGPGSETPPEPIEPPSHWDAETRERFRSADREWQEWLVGQDQAISEQRTTVESQFAPLQQAVAPWEGYMQRVGIDAASAINFFMPYEQALRTGNPVQQRNAILHLAERYGVKLEEPQADPKQRQRNDPLGFQRQIETSLTPVMQGQQQLADEIRRMNEDRSSRDFETTKARLTAFREAKDDKGKLLHPYYDELLEDMYFISEQLKARNQPQDPADIYNRAVRMNEGVWKKVQADEKAAEAARKKQTEKDQKASGGLAGGGGGGSAKPRSRRELLTEGLAEMRRAS